jgi:hypothetical protein
VRTAGSLYTETARDRRGSDRDLLVRVAKGMSLLGDDDEDPQRVNSWEPSVDVRLDYELAPLLGIAASASGAPPRSGSCSRSVNAALSRCSSSR